MKPPRCYVCGRDLDGIPDDEPLSDHFVVVYFALDAQEQAQRDALEAREWTGHPVNAVWFCRDHADLGASRTQLHWKLALAEIDAATGRG
jgi:hypothetical protein